MDSNFLGTEGQPQISTVITFPRNLTAKGTEPDIQTPVYDDLIADARKLDALSKFPCDFDYSIYRALELRFKNKPIHGGVVKKSPMKLVNSHASCQQCLYAFEIDSYGRGCVHNCLYCYAKAQLTVHGMWNNPIPIPIDINEVRRIFYTVFETDRKSKWRAVMERKVPLRIGCMSDSFMWLDRKYKVTQQLLKLLNYYQYPYTILTRSDLAAHDEYLGLIDKQLGSVQFSISSTNDELNKKIEPGAPPAENRLRALEKISSNGICTAVRINPIFPMYPDGYFSDPDYRRDADTPVFRYSTFDMVDEIADAGVPTIIAGFGRFSSFAINNINRATGVDLRPFFRRSQVYKSSRDYHYSDQEIRHYYEEYRRRCVRRAMEFSVCYIGNGESHFWETQDLWSNSTDCCNIKGKVPSFQTDSRMIPFDTRLLFTNDKTAKPLNPANLHSALGQPTAHVSRLVHPSNPEYTR
jgi:DNA repair photolyase